MHRLFSLPFPILITTEDKWFVAECPLLHIATQGKTEKEVKENMQDLIEDYLNDPDTSKEHLKDMASISLSYISVAVPQRLLHGKT